jgi:hypothetical protein
MPMRKNHKNWRIRDNQRKVNHGEGATEGEEGQPQRTRRTQREDRRKRGKSGRDSWAEVKSGGTKVRTDDRSDVSDEQFVMPRCGTQRS